MWDELQHIIVYIRKWVGSVAALTVESDGHFECIMHFYTVVFFVLFSVDGILALFDCFWTLSS